MGHCPKILTREENATTTTILLGSVAVRVCLEQPHLRTLHNQMQVYVLDAFVSYLALQNVFTFANEAIIKL